MYNIQMPYTNRTILNKLFVNAFLKCLIFVSPHDYCFAQRTLNPTIFNIWYFVPPDCPYNNNMKTSSIQNMYLYKSFKSN